MRGAFSEILLKKMEENPILKKALIRVFTLCLSSGIIFSVFSFSFFQNFYSEKNIFLYFVISMILAVFLGGFCSFLAFNNILIHIKKIIHELSQETPRWEWLEREYIESDIRTAYMAIKKLHLSVSEQSKLVGVAQLATQVAHDIRSPLVGLDLIIKDISNIPEEQRILIRNATNRIYNIANNLLVQYKHKTIGTYDSSLNESTELITELILDAISEKKNQYKNLPINFITEIDEASNTQFAKISAGAFKRSISNLLDNSVEALENRDNGTIIVKVSSQKNTISLVIEDNGCGISSHLLQKIMLRDIISQKQDGNGLGLSYAIRMVEDEWGGQFSIQSQVNEGTKIMMDLKQTIAPKWFVSELNILENTSIVILDDDENIHWIWQKRLSDFGTKVKIINFYNPEDLIAAYKHEEFQKPVIFFIDFEFIGHTKNGLDVINQLNLMQYSWLVTSRYDDQTIREKCIESGIKIISKKFALHIPIHIFNTEKNDNIIFIDDNKTLTDAWMMHGKRVGKTVHTFNTISSLKSSIIHFAKDTPIYIDSDLNDELSGQDFAKELFEQGFINLYLSTGYSENSFPQMTWIKEIIGKEPPF